MDDYDTDLARAIALSLEDQEFSGSAAPLSQLNDEESRFQKHTSEASRASSNATQDIGQPQNPEATRSSTPQSVTEDFRSQRQVMERERLARLARLRSEHGKPDEGRDWISREPSPNKRQRLTVTRTNDGDRSSPPSSSTSASSSPSGVTNVAKGKERPPDGNLPALGQIFWDGELRPTANRHCQPRKDGKSTFRLTEILGPKSEISFAILSSFVLSMSWIYEFFEPKTPVIVATQPDASGDAEIKNVLPNWVRTVPFLRNGWGCQHMKFMLIFYNDSRLRVIVSTANLMPYDWCDIENAVWLQDIPRRDAPISHDPKVSDDFPSLMQSVLRALNVQAALANMLTHEHPDLPIKSVNDLRSKWDWSKVTVKLIPSIAGKHEGWPAVVQTGHTRLMKALRELDLRTGKGKAAKELALECQGSSIGTYTTQWLNEFHYSARGESANDWLDQPKSRRTKLPWPLLKILFPSLQRVKNTVLGEAGGGTMFCQKRQWDGANFPRELFYDSVSVGGEVLMHTKMIIATFRGNQTPFSKSRTSESATGTTSKRTTEVITISDSETESETEEELDAPKQPLGWAYVGSHNFTPSAWGRLSGSTFNPILNITNYELGILLPLFSEDEIKKVSCFERPPRKYVLGKDRPWIQDECKVFQRSGGGTSTDQTEDRY